MWPKDINGTEFLRVRDGGGGAYNTWEKGGPPAKVLMHELVCWVFRIKSGWLEQNKRGQKKKPMSSERQREPQQDLIDHWKDLGFYFE